MDKDIKELLYTRLKELEEVLDKSVPEWYNLDDFKSGYITGIANMAKEEMKWLSNILHKMESE